MNGPLLYKPVVEEWPTTQELSRGENRMPHKAASAAKASVVRVVRLR